MTEACPSEKTSYQLRALICSSPAINSLDHDHDPESLENEMEKRSLASIFLAFLVVASDHYAAVSAFPAQDPWRKNDPWNWHYFPRNTKVVRVAYWPAYSADQYPASSIDSTLFTHLNYAFANLNASDNTVVPDDAARIAAFSRTVKSRNPSLKTLLSIGGGGADPKAFSAMASKASSRAAFIWSSIALARSNAFDGLDLDWEFPQNQTDMDNLGTLFAEWRFAAAAEAGHSGRPRLLLTAAVYYSGTIRFVGGGTYPTKSINANLDWVGLMAFDYHGSWEPTVTGAHTALYDPKSDVNTAAGVARWMAAGLRPDKGVLGLAMYGHSWILSDPSAKAGIGAPAKSPGPGDATPVFAGIVATVSGDDKATVVYDNVTVTAYAQVGSLWIGFDNEESIRNKVGFLRSKGMRGYFFWTASFDSGNGTLSRAAAAALGH
ncbi:class V chitinase [Selaginella moellendorffii]|uniref:class V chitinase n=1 Tax=Selaginella moellendorffii TaxID=88036 RepID=UPI000D1CB19B|nr:class V chitinase [Selaginella moellendorffii]|eukprot:XP_024529413.1 class V chitinase [Selaginella moellendorffii]